MGPGPLVLVGPDVLTVLAGATPARRGQVHVVAQEAVPDGLFRAALAVGAETVLELPAAEAWLVETLADMADGPSHRGGVVAVVGGCGGAGATTFAAALAATAATEPSRGAELTPVTLVDADPLGAGIEHVAGLDDLEGARWGLLLDSTGRLGSRSLRASLPQRGGLAVLGWGAGVRIGLRRDVVREVLSAAQRASVLVVVDLPRYLDPATEELLHSSDHLVVVTLPAVAAAAQVISRVRPLVPRGHLVARGPVSGLDPDEVAAALGMPLAAAMPDQRRLDEAVEMGLGPLRARRGPLSQAVVALRRCVEVCPLLGPVAAAGELGADVPAALRRAAGQPGASGLADVAAAWQVSQGAGGTMAVALGRVAGALRARRATQRLVASELASAQATARLVAALPLVVLLMGSGIGGDPWRFLLTTPPGLTCLALGLLLGYVGLAWIEKIAVSTVES